MTGPAAGVALALVAGLGAHYLYTATVLGWRGLRLGPSRPAGPPRRHRAREWLAQAGLGDVGAGEFLAVTLVVSAAGSLVGLALFGGPPAALAVGAGAAAIPPGWYRLRRRRRRAEAHEAWPRLIEEVRMRTSGAGRSVPQALLEAGRNAPGAMLPAFEAAQREWLLSTDFARAVAVLKAGLADPTADAACETLLVAHEVGGSGLDRRLQALAEDRALDVEGRKDARSRQAGVRFARAFVLAVPAGMAAVGMTIGTGRAAYATGWGQAMVTAGVVAVVGCWLWSGRLLRLPEEERVFYE